MDNHTFGIAVVTILGLLFIFGIGSIVLSFFFDSDKETMLIKRETNYHSSKQELSSINIQSLEEDDDEDVSVIITDNYNSFFDSTT